MVNSRPAAGGGAGSEAAEQPASRHNRAAKRRRGAACCAPTPLLRSVTAPANQSVPGVLRDQRIGVDLRLRNRHQHAVVRRRPRLELPGLRELAVPDQILAPLAFTVELEQALA